MSSGCKDSSLGADAPFLPFRFYSEGDSDSCSEVEDRVDGVKSWLSKNKGSAKNMSDDNLKSSRFDDRDFFSSSGLPGRFIDTPVGQLACLHLLPSSRD
ncbi:unconventional myosin-XVIIIa isoform X4 [Tachysurus ichikawai]